MHDTPTKLQEICIDSVCDNVWAFCSTAEQQQMQQSSTAESSSILHSCPLEKMELDDVKQGETSNGDQPVRLSRLPCLLSDEVLRRMSETGRLNDSTMAFFDSDRTSLKHVRLVAGSNAVTANGFDVLAQHNLESLALRNFQDKLNFERFVCNSLNDWTRTNLSALDCKGTFAYSLVDRIENISKFVNLRSLMVADTPFDDACLMRVCIDLPRLECLDISHTKVKDIGPLLLAKDRLRVLLIHRPRLRSVVDALDVLTQLYKLEAIDVSDFPKTSIPVHKTDQHRSRLGVALVSQASERCIWRDLRILDLSGEQANFDTNEFRLFLANHSNLEFIGLLMTNACFFDCLSSADTTKIAGDANKMQIFAALQTYASRDFFCSRSMYLLFGILQQNEDEFATLSDGERIFCIEQVLKGLNSNFDSLSVQMAGTACLYNLCRGERATTIHPSLLRQIVESSLTAIERHSKTPQLHKNVWLTLCNDHVLSSGAFDMFRCCTAALDSMVRNGEPSITRMTVAIISILAAKIPTEMTTKLGTNRGYMKYLLRVVGLKADLQQQWYEQNNVDVHNPNLQQAAPPAPDVTLKFTLSALWNLTDESPSTCRCLLEEGGLDVVIKVLTLFHDHSIETKVLGLLNNVAEVPELKSWLLSQSSLETIGRLLRSHQIDVSYFAAGILAHLCADQAWCCSPTRDECLQSLEESISRWIPADTEMVAYRSFKPFFSLLAKDDMPAVQLWAVWAIRHVCSKNVDRYVDMFKIEGGKAALERIMASFGQSTHGYGQSRPGCQLIYEVCKDILNLLAGNYV